MVNMVILGLMFLLIWPQGQVLFLFSDGVRCRHPDWNDRLIQIISCCRPEFLNRIDEIIVFRQLTKGEVKMIADIMLNEVFSRATEKGIKIDVTERFKVCALTLLLTHLGNWL